jgi:TonB-dependent SusC/RagA subfamily outer membrane receptor
MSADCLAAAIAAILCCASISTTGVAQKIAEAVPSSIVSGGIQSLAIDRTIDIDFDRLPFLKAVDSVCATAGLTFSLATRNAIEDSTVHTRRVSLHVRAATVGGVLHRLLDGTGLHVETVADNAIVLVANTPRTLVELSQQGIDLGVIRGVARDAASNAAIGAVTIRIHPFDRRVLTDVAGRYWFPALGPGHYTVTARRLGYAPTSREVELRSGDTATVDFALVQTAAQLDKVITTVVGDEHLRELGNDVGTVQVDSLVPQAAVTSISDVLTARVAGVQVFAPGGLLGASSSVNIQGQNNYNASNQPLLYVDGVRVDNSVAAPSTDGRFNDIVPEEIESIQVIRGPSAATMYGTAAGNGVILVTTKRGEIGQPRWTFFGQQGQIGVDSDRFPESYYAWGHYINGAGQGAVECTILLQYSGMCSVDSITHFSPFHDRLTTPLTTGSLANYGGQVSGGTSATRYFISGTYTDQVGYLKMPDADVALLSAERGQAGISSDERHPNSLDKYGVRANLVTSPMRDIDVSVASSLLSQRSNNPGSSLLTFGLLGPGYPGNTDGWLFGFRPSNTYETVVFPEEVIHTTDGVNVTWRLVPWLTLRADAGIDFSNDYAERTVLPNEAVFLPLGTRVDERTDSYLNTYDVTAIASTNLFAGWSSSTAIGANYNSQQLNANQAVGTNLAPGCSDLSCAGSTTGSENRVETKVAGGFIEQTLSFSQRLFIKAGVRADAGSTFQDFNAAIYPKASASWLVSQQPGFPSVPGISSLRLRVAYGESGLQPDPTATVNVERLSSAYVGGSLVPGSLLPTFANPNLKPEREREIEGGTDLDFLTGRVQVAVTAYRKFAENQLVLVNQPNSLGGQPEQVNAGTVRNQGFDATASARVLDSRVVKWDWAFNASWNHSKVLTLGSGQLPPIPFAGAPQITVGFPIYSFFDYGVHWVDRNHDGVPELNELTVDSIPHYIGPSYPTTQWTISQTMALFNGTITLSALLDHRGGFYIENTTEMGRCQLNECLAAVDPRLPKWQLVRYASSQLGGLQQGFYEDATFSRLREVSVTIALPSSVAHQLHARNASLTLAGRNLALWTKYTGIDPEVAGASDQSSVGAAGAYLDGGGLPVAQYWLLRVNLGL